MVFPSAADEMKSRAPSWLYFVSQQATPTSTAPIAAFSVPTFIQRPPSYPLGQRPDTAHQSGRGGLPAL